MFRLIEVNEAADEKIQPSIIIVIKPDSTGGPSGSRYSSLVGNIRKCAIPIVSIQDTAAILGYIKIGETVSVVIADGDAHSVAAAENTRLFCNVGKRAIAIVAIQGVAKGAGGCEEVARSAVD